MSLFKAGLPKAGLPKASLPKLSFARIALLALCVALPAMAALDYAAAESKAKSEWGEPVDLKPLMVPPVRPFLPPNSVLTPGSASSGSSYSSAPVYDGTRDQATPGLRLTIPSR
jgi:hypothetical protein